MYYYVSFLAQVSRVDLKVTSEKAEMSEKFVQSEEGGVVKVKNLDQSPTLTHAQAVEIAQLLVSVEEELAKPQDLEWAIENGQSQRCLLIVSVPASPNLFNIAVSVQH